MDLNNRAQDYAREQNRRLTVAAVVDFSRMQQQGGISQLSGGGVEMVREDAEQIQNHHYGQSVDMGGTRGLRAQTKTIADTDQLITKQMLGEALSPFRDFIGESARRQERFQQEQTRRFDELDELAELQREQARRLEEQILKMSSEFTGADDRMVLAGDDTAAMNSNSIEAAASAVEGRMEEGAVDGLKSESHTYHYPRQQFYCWGRNC